MPCPSPFFDLLLWQAKGFSLNAEYSEFERLGCLSKYDFDDFKRSRHATYQEYAQSKVVGVLADEYKFRFLYVLSCSS